ncbi:hypothetical protein WA158_005610 [Blastocystis sp. Blastoise]
MARRLAVCSSSLTEWRLEINHKLDQYIVSCGYDGSLAINRTPRYKTKISWGNADKTGMSASPVKCVSISGDYQYVTCGDIDGYIRVWETSSIGKYQTVYKSYNTKGNIVNCISFMNNPRLLAAGTNEGRLLIYDVSEIFCQQAIDATSDGSVTGLVLPPNTDTYVYTSHENGNINMSDLSTSSITNTLHGITRTISNLSPDWSNSMSVIAACDSDGPVFIWDTTTKSPSLSMTTTCSPVCLSLYDFTLALGTVDGNIVIYDIRNFKNPLMMQKVSENGINNIEFERGSMEHNMMTLSEHLRTTRSLSANQNEGTSLRHLSSSSTHGINSPSSSPANISYNPPNASPLTSSTNNITPPTTGLVIPSVTIPFVSPSQQTLNGPSSTPANRTPVNNSILGNGPQQGSFIAPTPKSITPHSSSNDQNPVVNNSFVESQQDLLENLRLSLSYEMHTQFQDMKCSFIQLLQEQQEYYESKIDELKEEIKTLKNVQNH